MSAVPVPLTATLCGLVDVLSKTCSVALRVPSAFGVNPIAILQLRPCASPVGGQVLTPVAANSAGSDEVTLSMNSGLVLPVFTTVRFLVLVF